MMLRAEHLRPPGCHRYGLVEVTRHSVGGGKGGGGILPCCLHQLPYLLAFASAAHLG